MDWARAIERNREALLPIIAGLFVLLGLDGSSTVARISWRIHYAVQRGLRPAESAVRRLIVIAARGLAVKLPPARPLPQGRVIARGKGSAARLTFQLVDRRKRVPLRSPRRKFKGRLPRIAVLGHDPTVAAMWAFHAPSPAPQPQPEDDGLVNAGPLCRRLQALKSALDDLPGQAQRLARWRAKRERAQALRPMFISPIRPGTPPGYRQKPVREVDHVLSECHGLALHAMALDTS
jgi:hypothetical protein